MNINSEYDISLIKGIITTRCCATCPWSITKEDEEELRIQYENNYDGIWDYYDKNLTHAGDCCIGMKRNKDMYCDEYLYHDSLIEHKIEEIMEQSRHQFIYGYNGRARKVFLHELEDLYPIKINENRPMAIYLDEFSLPNIKQKNKDANKIILSGLSRDYLNFSIAYNIIDRIIKIEEFQKLDGRENMLLQAVNRLFLNKDFSRILDIEELAKSLKTSREFYSKSYTEYIRDKSNIPNRNELQLHFINIDSFLNYVKSMLNNQSYFGVIVDHQTDIPNISKQAINDIITKRCNGNLSMKVGCEISNWNIFYDLNGIKAEYNHDYGKIVLDDSYSKHVRKLKKF